MKELGRTKATAQMNANIVQQHTAQRSTKLDDDIFTLLVAYVNRL